MLAFRSKKQPYAAGGQLLLIPTADILPNPEQPRHTFTYEQLLELSQSISENGLLQPLTVMMQNDRPVLVAGERRLRACKIAGLREVPCIVVDYTSAQAAVMALVENLQRADLNCFEEAEGIQRLIRLYGFTQEEVANRLGRAQPTIANKLRLLSLTPDEREALIAAGLTERHARALLRLPAELRLPLIRRMAAEKWTVAQTEREVERLISGQKKRQQVTPLVRDVRLFFNTVNHAVETMRRSGINASAERSETAEYFEYVVRIPKSGNSTGKVVSVESLQSPGA